MGKTSNWTAKLVVDRAVAEVAAAIKPNAVTLLDGADIMAIALRILSSKKCLRFHNHVLDRAHGISTTQLASVVRAAAAEIARHLNTTALDAYANTPDFTARMGDVVRLRDRQGGLNEPTAKIIVFPAPLPPPPPPSADVVPMTARTAKAAKATETTRIAP